MADGTGAPGGTDAPTEGGAPTDGDSPGGTGAPAGEGAPGPVDPGRVRRVARGLNRAYHRRLGRRTHDPRGVDVVAADWDLLVVLDACRPDAFEAVLAERGGTALASWPDAASASGTVPASEIASATEAASASDTSSASAIALAPDAVERRRSRGSHTAEFLWGSFAGRELHDAVYVTANVQPYVYRDVLDLHHVAHAWVDGFDETVGTVPPGAVTEAALAAAERFPRKRLVVHYLQPHYPFLDGPEFAHGTMDFWDAVATDAVDAGPDQLRAWHERNLRRALPAVERLLAGVEGRAVVTADHGTALGERVWPVPVREWGHPWGVYARPLVEVPWLVRPATGERPAAVPEPPVEEERYDEAAVAERLAALGYA